MIYYPEETHKFINNSKYSATYYEDSAKEEGVPPSEFFEEYFLPVIHLTPFYGHLLCGMYWGTHFSQTTHANIRAH